jgi:hypothetical protein
MSFFDTFFSAHLRTFLGVHDAHSSRRYLRARIVQIIHASGVKLEVVVSTRSEAVSCVWKYRAQRCCCQIVPKMEA